MGIMAGISLGLWGQVLHCCILGPHTTSNAFNTGNCFSAKELAWAVNSASTCQAACAQSAVCLLSVAMVAVEAD
jgi:hypothetical protein